jgi:acetyl-CoA carboxylase biotin carboxyl carrier protein
LARISNSETSNADAGVSRRVRSVLDTMRRLDLSELEIRIGDDRVAVRRHDPGAAAVSPAATPAAGPQPPPPPAGTPVTSPLAGTYYGSPRPGAEPFVRVGAQVASGDPIGLVEAMKVFNEITTDHSGEVVAVLVENGDTIAAGQHLIIVDTGAQS